MLYCMTPEQQAAGFLVEIRAERARQGVSIDALAKSLGTDATSLSRKLRGERELKFRESLAICEALQVTVSTLLSRINDGAAA